MDLKCLLRISAKEFQDGHGILRHIKSHILSGFKIDCPMINCTKSYDIVSSFTAHMSRSHGPTMHRTLSDGQSCGPVPIQDHDESNAESTLVNFTGPEAMQNANSRILFYMSLRFKHLVPISTINIILQEYADLKGSYEEQLKTKVQKELIRHGASKSESELICSNILNETESAEWLQCSEYSRDNFVKSKLNYIAPVAFRIGATSSFQYVPLLVDHTSRKRAPSSDEYGCVQWSPFATDDEMHDFEEKCEWLREEYRKAVCENAKVLALMDETYPLQRQFINKNFGITDVRDKWPFLFQEVYLYHHYEKLVGKQDAKASLLSNFADRSMDIYRGLKTSILPKIAACIGFVECESKMLDSDLPKSSCFIDLISSYMMKKPHAYINVLRKGQSETIWKPWICPLHLSLLP